MFFILNSLSGLQIWSSAKNSSKLALWPPENCVLNFLHHIYTKSYVNHKPCYEFITVYFLEIFMNDYRAELWQLGLLLVAQYDTDQK